MFNVIAFRCIFRNDTFVIRLFEYRNHWSIDKWNFIIGDFETKCFKWIHFFSNKNTIYTYSTQIFAVTGNSYFLTTNTCLCVEYNLILFLFFNLRNFQFKWDFFTQTFLLIFKSDGYFIYFFSISVGKQAGCFFILLSNDVHWFFSNLFSKY